MTSRTKQVVALGMATLWILLTVIGFSDEFAALQGAPSNIQPTVIRIVPSNFEPVVYISDDVPAVPTFAESDGSVIGGTGWPPRSESFTSFIVDHPPPHSGTKLFQLLSIYRI